MQDKDLHIDKKLTDQAWKKMESLLDSELPVPQTKRKKGLIFWFVGMAGIAALMAGLYFFSQQKADGIAPVSPPYPDRLNNQQQIENETTAPIIALENEPSNVHHPLPESNEKNTSTPNKKNSQPTEKQIINPVKTSPKTRQEPSRNILPFPEKEQLAVVEQVPTESKTTEKIAAAGLVAAESENKNDQEPPPFIAKELPGKIDHIVFSEIESVTSNQPRVSAEGLHQRHGGHILSGGFLFSPGSQASGFSIGYLNEIKKIKNKHALRVGINYKYLSQPVHYFFTVLETNTTGFPQTGDIDDALVNISYATNTVARVYDQNGNFFNIERNASDYSFDQLNMHYLFIPVSMRFQHGRFSYVGGLRAGLLLLAKNYSLQGGFLSDIGLADDAETVFNAGVSNPDTFQKPELASVDFSVNLGVGYSLTKNVRLHIDYSLGIKDIIPKNQSDDFNRFFQVGMEYQW